MSSTVFYRPTIAYARSYLVNTGIYVKNTLKDALFLKPLSGVETAEKSLGFQKLEAWGIGTDIDIGGFSTASLTTTADGSIKFSGNISLALQSNAEAMYSGYAAMRTRVPLRRHLFHRNTIDCSKWAFMILRLKGDHRQYNFNFKIRNSLTGDLYSTRIKFLKPYEWEDVIVKYFRRTNCGVEYARQYEPNLENVESFGFLLSDNLPGPFALEFGGMKVTNFDYKYVEPSDEDVEFLTKNLADQRQVETWKDGSDNFYGFGFDFGGGNIEDTQKYMKRFHKHTSTGRIYNPDWEITVVPSAKPTLKKMAKGKSIESQ